MNLPPRRHRIEWCLIAIAAGSAWMLALSGRLPPRLPLGEVILGASALLLAQGLVRDVAIKLWPPPACPVGPGGAARSCLCAESTVGTAGVAAGVLALLAAVPIQVPLPSWSWPVAILVIGAFGFLIKSLVIDWKNRRVIVVSDHRTVRS